MTSRKIPLISNMCLCLLLSSLVSLWQHCAVFPVAVETRSLSSDLSIVTTSSFWHRLSTISLHSIQSCTLSHISCLWTPQVPPPVSVQVLAWRPAWSYLFLNEASMLVSEGWNQSAFFRAADTYALLFLSSRVTCAIKHSVLFSSSHSHVFFPLVFPPPFDISFFLP